MTPAEVVAALSYKISPYFPHEAVLEATRQHARVTPLLLSCLEEVKADPHLLEKENYILPIYSFFLLARFREERAFALIAEIMACEDPDFCDWLGDFVTEYLTQVLVSTGNRDLEPLQRLIENRAASVWCRGAAVRAMEGLVAIGRCPREEVVGYYAELLHGKLEREPSNVWNALVDSATFLHPGELSAEIGQAYDDGLVDNWYCPRADVVAAAACEVEAVLAERRNSRAVRDLLITDVVAEMSSWPCFNQVQSKPQNDLFRAPPRFPFNPNRPKGPSHTKPKKRRK